jgi:hypothetical protein
MFPVGSCEKINLLHLLWLVGLLIDKFTEICVFVFFLLVILRLKLEILHAASSPPQTHVKFLFVFFLGPFERFV